MWWVIAVGVAWAVAHGQEPRSAGGLGYVAVGIQEVGSQEVWQRLEQAGYGMLPRTGFAIGGGGGGWIGRWFLGGEGYGILERESAGSRGVARYAGRYGMFTLGYAPVLWRGFRMWILGSIGGGELEVRLRQALPSSFDSVLAQPRGSALLRSGGWLFQPGIRAELQLVPGLLAGVQLGYTVPLGWGALRAEDESTLAGAPTAALRGGSVRIFLGGGAPWRKAYRDSDGH